MKRLALVLVTALAALAGPASAQVPPPPPPAGPPPFDPTINRHLGFYLHLDLGFGALSSKASDPFFGDIKLSGGGASFSIAAGGAISENFIIAGHIWGHSVSSPEITTDIGSATASGATLNLTGIGPSLVWYVMPSNFYFSLTPSLTTLSVEYNGQKAETETGLGLQFSVGKEWWVSDHWGIGLNGQIAIASNKDKGTNAPTWNSSAFAIAFSATYN